MTFVVCFEGEMEAVEVVIVIGFGGRSACRMCGIASRAGVRDKLKDEKLRSDARNSRRVL